MQKSGTSALIAALESADGGTKGPFLVTATDQRKARAAGSYDLWFGDAAASLLVGGDDGVVGKRFHSAPKHASVRLSGRVDLRRDATGDSGHPPGRVVPCRNRPAAAPDRSLCGTIGAGCLGRAWSQYAPPNVGDVARWSAAAAGSSGIARCSIDRLGVRRIGLGAQVIQHLMSAPPAAFGA